MPPVDLMRWDCDFKATTHFLTWSCGSRPSCRKRFHQYVPLKQPGTHDSVGALPARMKAYVGDEVGRFHPRLWNSFEARAVRIFTAPPRLGLTTQSAGFNLKIMRHPTGVLNG